ELVDYSVGDRGALKHRADPLDVYIHSQLRNVDGGTKRPGQLCAETWPARSGGHHRQGGLVPGRGKHDIDRCADQSDSGAGGHGSTSRAPEHPLNRTGVARGNHFLSTTIRETALRSNPTPPITSCTTSARE